MKKLGVIEFFKEKLGGHKKIQEMFGWLQILMTILFNELDQMGIRPNGY